MPQLITPANFKIIYSHGRVGAPGSRKAAVITATARSLGYEILEVDYVGVDLPADRVRLCESICAKTNSNLVFAGSSMGAYVSVELADRFPTVGLFLIAPAFYLEGYPNQTPRTRCPNIQIMHGWRDSVVAPENAFRFAEAHKARIEFVDDDHHMLNHVEYIADQFAQFLKQLSLDIPTTPAPIE